MGWAWNDATRARLNRKRGGWGLAVIIALGAALRWWTAAPFEISHADELMQYLEQGRRLATGDGIIPWEYRVGARNALIAQLLAPAWWAGATIAPGTLAPMLAARTWLAALSLVAIPAAWRLGAMAGHGPAVIAALVTAGWYESVLFSDLILSETLAAALLLSGAALLLGGENNRRMAAGGAFVVGLAVIVRLQYAPFAAILVMGAIGLDRRRWAALAAGALSAMGIGAASDLATGRGPYAWIKVNFDFNIAAGRAARFGTEGPPAYAEWIWTHLGPFAPAILIAAALAGRRYWPLLAAAIANVAVHSLIAHKEYRFVWASVLALLVLAAIGSARVVERLARRRSLAPGAAMAVLVAGWSVASLAAERWSGGAQAMRGGAAIPMAAQGAARDPAVCGIALPMVWRAHLVPALLPRPVPLYLAEEAQLTKPGGVPPALSGAANALLLSPAIPPPAGYAARGCTQRGPVTACLYVRPGQCTSAAEWSYQSALEREGL
jgi:hypothetical protein